MHTPTTSITSSTNHHQKPPSPSPRLNVSQKPRASNIWNSLTCRPTDFNIVMVRERDRIVLCAMLTRASLTMWIDLAAKVKGKEQGRGMMGMNIRHLGRLRSINSQVTNISLIETTGDTLNYLKTHIKNQST